MCQCLRPAEFGGEGNEEQVEDDCAACIRGIQNAWGRRSDIATRILSVR